MFAETIRDRISSLCASDPFGFTEALTPFTFDLQPTGTIDGGFRVTARIPRECSKLVGCTHPAFGAGSMISSASAEYLATSASTRQPTSRWNP